MTPSSCKAKGRTLQKRVRDAILAMFPALQDGDVRSTSMGAGGEDVQLSPAARQLLPYQFECKSRKAFAVYKDFDQCGAHGPHEPVLVIKQNRSEPLVIVRLDTFLELNRRAAEK